MITAIYVIGIIVLILCIAMIFIIVHNDKLNNLLYKCDMCEKDLDDNLKKKEDDILRLINIINRELSLDIKEFEDVRNIKSNKLSLNEKDILLNKVLIEIKKIYVDNYDKLNEVKSFDGIIVDLDKEEIKLISLRTLFNKCAGEFNILTHKFPNNLIVKFRKINEKKLYEGKELQEVIEKELNNLVI